MRSLLGSIKNYKRYINNKLKKLAKKIGKLKKIWNNFKYLLKLKIKNTLIWSLRLFLHYWRQCMIIKYILFIKLGWKIYIKCKTTLLFYKEKLKFGLLNKIIIIRKLK